MRLGLALLTIHINKIPYRFRGKYRRVKKPSLHDLLKMKQDFEREEQNMLILRHPYLTLEQSHGHMKDMYVNSRKQKFFEKVLAENRQKFQKEITIAERLCHMRVTEAWD
ncbi:Ribosomal protein 63, mitochondrial [Trachymyrmex zeteki]|uniref:Ribosomal protein 63, mitochondrial n=1 Tax=Mycetomoellerius zeteki TaxID=64791 RepID=A0A151WLU3_9HYME|nr:PREDICTED: ribosomal protein 63, mitochondrial [Trachymyrmex zeteki]XP_018312595.1 PREDICTED: ribosomal protein 63, mitochondrial [Trachymyrmex zeteki]KYQ48862.1 Ribosomal protein 63, mitochondrial [Trachymyrmex zeteki]